MTASPTTTAVPRAENNARTEERAKGYLVSLNEGFQRPTAGKRKSLLAGLRSGPVGHRLLDEDECEKYKGSFDLVLLSRQYQNPLPQIPTAELDTATLIEVKSSGRDLEHYGRLDGYYFSVQQREIELAEKLHGRLLFAFVVLPRSGGQPFHELLAWEAIKGRAKSMRQQWNINL